MDIKNFVNVKKLKKHADDKKDDNDYIEAMAGKLIILQMNQQRSGLSFEDTIDLINCTLILAAIGEQL